MVQHAANGHAQCSFRPLRYKAETRGRVARSTRERVLLRCLFDMRLVHNVYDSFEDAIGNTPLIKLRRASERTGCNIYGKAEFMEPGGSVKDRAALYLLTDAEKRGTLKLGSIVVEGTAGNTGIGLTLLGNSRGYRTVIVIPETQSEEKKEFLRSCGAELVQVPAAPYRNPNNYVRLSERLAKELGAFWANQFDNPANRRAHEETTGPEIWDQLDGHIDAFNCAVGTGGTLAGVSAFLRAKNPGIKIALTDPQGAALVRYYQCGELVSVGDSITEGIGQSRITGNLEGFVPDMSFEISDAEALQAAYDVVRHEGLHIGLSSGINIAGAIRVAESLGPGHTIVTILCDGGSRYQKKMFQPSFLEQKKLPIPTWLSDSMKPDLAAALSKVYVP
ncbi:O-acetylserine (thiol)-lyase 2 [Cyanidioschyzon merolae strain 10D]|jgi:cysteine synthase A|uniref:Cysteine synthase 1 n=2 Tax=Cyanidioschyzon merolae TaxID=45157 RepID=A0A125YZ85_CYAM1|nr:O-acetylserine (thiol)-lyase 2 [Cyanidioschyzon merolae strain 10D]BAA85111.1 O-acetylserine (thiol) lyase 2 [Cyanidioschyzon merolae]BAM79737.1 O-acetylserine (thiol)-lyase 2 [Cyanidioschyzon merolae strain 10D]|eukprot:XP_005536023.1 O-acetylserine (thiol)-lyase 2 [Cyanidioschyzon merolae strain 10D]